MTNRILLVGLLLAVFPALIVPHFVSNVTPARDLITGVLTLSPAPSPASSVELYANGLRQRIGSDFTVSGGKLTPMPKAAPLYKDPATVFVVDYRF